MTVVGVGTVLEQEDEVVLVQADEEEQHGAGEHAEGVEGGVAPVAAAELGHHGHHRHVEEHAHRAGQQPRGGGALGPQHQPRHQAHEGEHRGHAVVEDRDLDTSPQSKLTQTIKFKTFGSRVGQAIKLQSQAKTCRHLDAHAGVEQQGEVPDLVRQLVAEHGDGGGEARGEAHGEGRAHRDPVREVVHGVADDDHEAGGRHGAAAGAAQRLVAAVPLVQTVQAAHTLRLETRR